MRWVKGNHAFFVATHAGPLHTTLAIVFPNRTLESLI